MRRGETVFSLALTLLSVGYLYFVWQMDVGTLLEPGPGFMPAVVGVMAFATSVLILLGSLKGAPEKKPAEAPSKDGAVRLAVTVAVIVAFIPLFKILGAMAAIFLLAFAINKTLGAKGWLEPFVLAAACSIATWAVFVLALDVPLPRGIF